MRAIDRMYFDRYAVDPDIEDLGVEALLEGWIDDCGNENLESSEFHEEDWQDLV